MNVDLWRFMGRAQENKGTGCWEWAGSRHRQGYGNFFMRGRVVLAHRASWFLHHGYMPSPDVKVCHRCDNPPCVNPDHLFLGSQLDNARDCIAKGRARKAKPLGEKNPMARLTDDQVMAILRSTRRQRELAREYKVAESTISMIKRGRNWPHLFAEWQSHEATKRQEMRL